MTREHGRLARAARRILARAAALAGMLTLCAGCAVEKERSFSSPEAGARALARALDPYDESMVLAVLGPGGDDIISSGDPVADRELRGAFLDEYNRGHRIQMESDDSATLLVGDDDWPLPIPLVRHDNGWRFDTPSGREEILARRIGRNELDTIQVCRAIVDAQQEYADADPERSGVRQYAQKFVSDPGTRDGLYWEAEPGEPQSPLGGLFAQASEEGYTLSPGRSRGPRPYHGYYYRMLTDQGDWAPGGAHSYIVNGRMTGGFAAIAWPADYGNSGIKTFMVSHAGIVYENDLGPDSARIASTMTAFDPDPGWEVVP